MATYTYSNCDGTNDRIDYIRLLISDTDAANFIFSNEEIEGAYRIQGGTWQSAMRYSSAGGAYLPSLPVSLYRVAALLLDAVASNKSRLSSITQLLDVKLAPEQSAKALRDIAASYREIDDNSGAFAIAEQVHNHWSFRDRVFKQYQRLQGAA